jgi:hypothetical protein
MHCVQISFRIEQPTALGNGIFWQQKKDDENEAMKKQKLDERVKERELGLAGA